MLGRRRYRSQVRATRAYLAGFGTSGSLLAGAAVLFVLASAIVAFRGWPQVATQPATAAVTVPASALGTSSRDTRRLTAVLAGRIGRSAVLVRRSVSSRARGHGTRIGTGTAAGGTAPQSTPGTVAGSSVQGASGATSSSGGGCTGTCTVSASEGTVTKAVGNAGQTVSNAGSAVGSEVSGVAGTVAGGVGGTSPPAAGAVQGAANTAGGAVSGVGNAASGTVTSIGNALGGGQ